MSSVENQKQMNVDAEGLAKNVKILAVDDGVVDHTEFDRKCQISAETGDIDLTLEPPSASIATCTVATCENSNTFTSAKLDADVNIDIVKISKRPNKNGVYDKYTHPCLPKINCPEKIIFCIDMSSELEEIPFRKNDGSQHSALSMVKRTIEFFVHNKHFVDKKHEYSLMVLYESATWVREFTNNVVDFIDSLEDLNETQVCNACDLASIVKLISEKFELPLPVRLTSAPYSVRVVLIYGRSNCMFHFSDESLQELLMRHPLLFLDILYIHEPPSSQNKSKEIYDALCDLDEQNKSYIFEVTSNITKLHNCMAKFLAHPLQRAAQKDTAYKIRPVEH